jgi:polysaccharide pyruvyl transferase WcaK-like protein
LHANKKIRRVGLISPCLGNLGNAAILSSMIANIRKRTPDAEIVGITLSPEDTWHRHGIAAFPLAGAPRPNYTAGDPGVRRELLPPASYFQRAKFWIKQWLRRVPLIRRLSQKFRSCRSECAHILASARLVRTLDRVIVTGGGALDDFWGGPWGHPWTLFKFAALSRICRAPLQFVSVGKCALESPLSRFFARNALRMAEYRSYRDLDSKLAVQALQRSFDDPVCPDLAYAYPCPAVPAQRASILSGERLVVGVSPMAYCDPRFWPLKDEQRHLRYLHQLGLMLRWLLKQRYRVLLFATDNPDTESIRDLQAMSIDDSVDASLLEVLPGPPQQTTEGLMQRICKADLIIASRLHGIILSQLIGIPTLAISYDRKVDVHMNDVKQSEYCVNIDLVDVETLIRTFNQLKNSRRQESDQLSGIAQLYRRQLDAQYDQLFGPIPFDYKTNENRGQLITAVQSR